MSGPEAPNLCRVCGLPVPRPSMGGPDLCPACDCGVYRDGTPWDFKEATNPELVRERAQLREEDGFGFLAPARARPLRPQALATLKSMLERAQAAGQRGRPGAVRRHRVHRAAAQAAQRHRAGRALPPRRELDAAGGGAPALLLRAGRGLRPVRQAHPRALRRHRVPLRSPPMSARRFPVLSPTSRKQRELREQLGCPTSVPWEMLAPHEERARRNHDQSLERLAERGGLSPMEMVCVLGDKRWVPTEPAWAILRLKELVAEWELRTRALGAT